MVENYHSSGKVEEKVIILAFEDVHFDFDEVILTKEAQVILSRSIQILKKKPLKLESVLQGIPLLPPLTPTTKG